MIKLCSLWILSSLIFLIQAHAEEKKLIFEDHFNRSESQELVDEPGFGWTTSSNTTAGGHKQVDLRDGHLYIYTHESAWHATSVRHTFQFKDGCLAIRFKFDDAKDNLILNFTDLSEKSVHAGHLFNVTLTPKELDIRDLKTGVMNLDIMKLRKAKKLSPQQEHALEAKRNRIPIELELGKWHEVLVDIQGDEVSCTINGQMVGQHRSEGFAHPLKGMIRLLANRNVHVDDIRVWKTEIATH